MSACEIVNEKILHVHVGFLADKLISVIDFPALFCGLDPGTLLYGKYKVFLTNNALMVNIA